MKELNNYSVKCELQDLLERYEHLYKSLQNRVVKLPKGKITIARDKEYLSFRYSYVEKGTRKIESITKDTEKSNMLLEKYNINFKLEKIAKICILLEEIIRLQEYEFIEDYQKYMKKNFAKVPVERFEPNYRKALEWKKQCKEESDSFREEGLKIEDNFGGKVRSKSEYIIL